MMTFFVTFAYKCSFLVIFNFDIYKFYFWVKTTVWAKNNAGKWRNFLAHVIFPRTRVVGSLNVTVNLCRRRNWGVLDSTPILLGELVDLLYG